MKLKAQTLGEISSGTRIVQEMNRLQRSRIQRISVLYQQRLLPQKTL